MKYFRILTVAMLTTIQAYGQQQYHFTGKVIDSSNLLPLAGTTVSITGIISGKITTIQSDEKGLFKLAVLPEDSFSLQFTRVGYETRSFFVNHPFNKGKTDYSLLDIKLLSDNKELGNVTVQSKKQVIKQEIDRLSYDVQADADGRTQSVLELMSKIPMLSLDGEENVLLKGSSNYRIFINGRPSSMMAHNPKEALRAMPANTVQKIEVITTPPAKYDAEGLAGIINIVLIKRLSDGYNGTIGANINNTVGSGENASLTARAGKLGVSGRGFLYQDFRRSLQQEKIRETSYPVTTLLKQDGTYSYIGYYALGNMEISYDIDSLNLLTVAANMHASGYRDRTVFSNKLYDATGTMVQGYEGTNINPQHESGWDVNANYQHGFKNIKDVFLTFSYQLHHFPNWQNNELLFDQKVNFAQPNYKQDSRNGTEEHTFQADYVRPFKKYSIEGGVKAILRHNYSDFTNLVFAPSANGYIPDPSLDDHFRYDQQVYSIYASGHLKFKKMEAKAGVRLERTNTDGRFMNTNTQLETGYSNLIPVLSLLRKFEHSGISIGFTQRILRPGIYQLNPFVDRSNPQFIRSGNPALKPVLNNNIELSYNYFRKVNMNLMASYAFANNDVQQVTELIDSTSFSSYQNIGKNKTAVLNASISCPISTALSFSLNSSLTYVWLEGNFGNVLYRNDGLEGYAYGNLTYKMKKDLRATLTATFISADVRLQGKANAYVVHTYRLSKDLVNKKLAVSVFLSNPFKKYREIISTTHAADFDQTIRNQRFYRAVGVNVNYSFGNLKKGVQKSRRSINNDDNVGKGD